VLVLLDMTMPDMDGEQTLRVIRQVSSVPPFTARQLGEVSSWALEAGPARAAPSPASRGGWRALDSARPGADLPKPLPWRRRGVAGWERGGLAPSTLLD
jgi:hypothetical protein